MDANLWPPDLDPDRLVACLGLISDTHIPKRWPDIPPAVFRIFEGVNAILHAGDVGRLWVLERLSAIAPIHAVHGNDESDEAQRELPLQQVVVVGGHRILLNHGHIPDRQAERASRVGDEWRPKLAQRAAQARQAGASIMVFGHLHIPFARRFEGIWLVNPGAIASGSAFTRQTRQTVALLYVRDDGRPFVSHVDLARPDRPCVAAVDWEAGFAATHRHYNENIAEGAVMRLMEGLREVAFFDDRRLWEAFSRPGMSRWLGETKAAISVDELRHEIATDEAFTIAERESLLRLFPGK